VEQKAVAERIRDELFKAPGRGSAVRHTALEEAGPFYRAEEYHQKWYEKQRTKHITPA
jgi:peptide methionine sulfoxide reductase MsrA